MEMQVPVGGIQVRADDGIRDVQRALLIQILILGWLYRNTWFFVFLLLSIPQPHWEPYPIFQMNQDIARLI